MKKIVALTLVFLMLFANISLANSIDTINIKAEIKKDGSVMITDHRIFQADSGTEHYISLGNLGDSIITDFKVLDENNKLLEEVEKWDVNASREEKAGKYGINFTSKGVELCFGIGELGRREFTIQYRVTNFIKNLNDGNQTFYWKFINEDMDPISFVNIEITNEIGYKFEAPTTRIWGYGYKGQTAITSDKLTATTDKNDPSINYMVVLGIFDGKVFDSQSKLDKSTDQLIEQSRQGSFIYRKDGSKQYYKNQKDGSKQYYKNQKDGSKQYYKNQKDNGGLFKFILKIVVVLTGAVSLAISKRRKNNLKFVETDNLDYYRDLPDENFLILDYLVEEANVQSIISALLLKWIVEERLVNKKIEEGFIFKKEKDVFKINFTDTRPFDSTIEKDFWDIVLKACGKDDILTQSELNSYIKNNTKRFNTWMESINKTSKNYLIRNNYVKEQSKKSFFGSTLYERTEKGINLQKQIYGLKKYLLDFSLLNERDVNYVKLWDKYMIWAAYLGITKEVYEQFKVVDPQFEQQVYYNPATFIYINSISNSAYNSSIQSSSSGFGGSSFGGGGGGSFGGGSGGGTR
ncbi:MULTISPECIES: DUF2207 family protein [Helcococcus]|uniref:DUF2207 domain-containing protein n=1 Tax=Helcococcus bovis TaxID=3153252 RepID=A0ABW9F6A6_9FIRM